jgi:hypothetical protein
MIQLPTIWLRTVQLGFVCSKTRARAIDSLLTMDLKVPSGWSRPRLLLTSTTGLKIADCLAFCGPYGAYVIGLTDIQDKYKKLFITLLNDTIRPILLCTPKDPRLPALQASLVLFSRFVDLMDVLSMHVNVLSVFLYVL